MDTTSEDKKYGGLNLPIEIIQRIDEAILKNGFGFRSRAEFVTYCVRKEIDRINGVEA